MRKIIEMFTEKGQKVLDCFAGSGTTLLACKQLGRDFIGIEKEKMYFDICNQRLSQQILKLEVSYENS